jgi:hypothetical protein
MAVLWIFLVLMTMAFLLLYPVVSMTRQFRQESSEIFSIGVGPSKQSDKSQLESLITGENSLLEEL